MDATAARTLASCASRAAGSLGSSNGYNEAAIRNVGGLLSPYAALNPGFSNATFVFVHYCDGTSYSSYRADPVPVISGTGSNITQIFFRGRANLVATTKWLLAAEGMMGATDVILTGGSAGATGVFIGVDAFRELLPTNVRLVGNPDAGFFPDLPRAGNASFFWYRESFRTADGVWGSSAAGHLNAACLSANIDAPYRCFLAQYTTPFINTPLYISNSAVDMWGLMNILELNCIPTQTNSSTPYIPGTPCAPAGWEELQGWSVAFQAALLPLLRRNPALGAWIVSCYVHEINVDYCSTQELPNCRGWAKYKIGAYTLSTAFPKWHKAALRDWPATLRAFEEKAEEARSGGGGGGGGGGGAGQLAQGQSVDPYTYPMNPSCYYPPG